MFFRYSRVFAAALVLTVVAAKPQRDVYDDLQPNDRTEPQEARNIKPRAYQSVHPNQNQLGIGAGFRPQHAEENVGHIGVQQVRRPAFAQDSNSFQNSAPIRQPAHVKRPHSQLSQELKTRLEEEEEELDKEEPDRLSQLLPESKFDCIGRNTGYYADEGLGCEVFHYCHDNTKHSWICPDGFTFHQVHLICMPPSNDNICQKSSQYHFVNEYLYKPLNAEEAQSRPNVTLRYSERYYPSEFYYDGRYEEDESNERVHQEQPARRPTARPIAPSPTPVSRRPQVFRSPEDVDIPLLQRRPLHIPQPFHPSNNQEFEYEKK